MRSLVRAVLLALAALLPAGIGACARVAPRSTFDAASGSLVDAEAGGASQTSTAASATSRTDAPSSTLRFAADGDKPATATLTNPGGTSAYWVQFGGADVWAAPTGDISVGGLKITMPDGTRINADTIAGLKSPIIDAQTRYLAAAVEWYKSLSADQRAAIAEQMDAIESTAGPLVALFREIVSAASAGGAP